MNKYDSSVAWGRMALLGMFIHKLGIFFWRFVSCHCRFWIRRCWPNLMHWLDSKEIFGVAQGTSPVVDHSWMVSGPLGC